MTKETNYGFPAAHGLHDPANEHDSCGVGFIAHIKGQRSHEIVKDACEMLSRMEHRGACGCETNTGDGAGIMTALPIDLLRRAARESCGIELPEEGRFAAGNIFLPQDDQQRQTCRVEFERIVQEQGQEVLGWRPVPVDADAADIGPSARGCQPVVEQVFIAASADTPDRMAFERQLFLIRKRVSHEIREGDLPQALMFYVCSL
jgi:glutamate synthase (NADPH/NADH) large chain